MEFDFSKYPICDTDIWVNICLADLHSRLFAKYEKLVFADVVEGEIMAWNKNPDFSFIAENFDSYKKHGEIFVIQHDVHIYEEDRKILETTLYQLGFQIDFKNQPPEKNKGEFVSAIYADHFGIPLMQSNDGAFQEGGRGRVEFPDLRIKNWYEIIEELVPSDREKIQIRKRVEAERQRMNRKYERIKDDKKKETLLLKLQERINSKRL